MSKNTHAAMEAITQSSKPHTDSMALTPFQELKLSLAKPEITNEFAKVLGRENSARFIASVVSLVRNPDPAMVALRKCTPNSIIYSAMCAAITGLSIEKHLGQAALVPFGDKATFMPQKRGLQKLALQSGGIEAFNVAPVYEGDIKKHNPFTGEFIYDEAPHERTKLIGYIGYIKRAGGFEHYEYMTLDELIRHGKRYSKSYSRGLWTTNPEVMYQKTIAKKLCSEFGALDPFANIATKQLSMALAFDGASPKTLNPLNELESNKIEYIDAIEAEDITIQEVGKEIENAMDYENGE